jgi:hypothetical protein
MFFTIPMVTSSCRNRCPKYGMVEVVEGGGALIMHLEVTWV